MLEFSWKVKTLQVCPFSPGHQEHYCQLRPRSAADEHDVAFPSVQLGSAVLPCQPQPTSAEAPQMPSLSHNLGLAPGLGCHCFIYYLCCGFTAYFSGAKGLNWSPPGSTLKLWIPLCQIRGEETSGELSFCPEQPSRHF